MHQSNLMARARLLLMIPALILTVGLWIDKAFAIEEPPQTISYLYSRLSMIKGVANPAPQATSMRLALRGNQALSLERLIVSTSLNRKIGEQHLAVRNEKYSFSLSRPSDDAEWILQGFQLGTGKSNADDTIGVADVLNTIDKVQWLTLIELARPKSPSRPPATNDPTAPPDAVSFNTPLCKGDESPEKATFDIEGWYVRDRQSNPDALREYAIDYYPRDPARKIFRRKATLEYQPPGKNGTPRLAKVETDYYRGLKDSDYKDTEVIDGFDYSVPYPDPSEFRLTHYGLPEPPGIVWSRPTPRWVWLAGIGGTCLVVGLTLRFLVQRRKGVI